MLPCTASWSARVNLYLFFSVHVLGVYQLLHLSLFLFLDGRHRLLFTLSSGFLPTFKTFGLFSEVLYVTSPWHISLTSDVLRATNCDVRTKDICTVTTERVNVFLISNCQRYAVAQWLRRCASNRKVAGSIPDGVIGILHWHNPSDRTMALGSTEPLTEMSTRSISWG